MTKTKRKPYNTAKRKKQNQILKIKLIVLATALITGLSAIAGASVHSGYEPAEIAVKRAEPQAEYKGLKVYTPEEAKKRIIEIAKKRNFNQLDKFLRVINCESRFNQFSYNVNKDGSVDRGLCMFNDYWHSNMSNQQTFDVDYCVNRMMDYWDKGSSNLWACTKILGL